MAGLWVKGEAAGWLWFFFSRRTFCIGRPTKTASIMMEGALNVGNYVGANKNSKKVISMGALIIPKKILTIKPLKLYNIWLSFYSLQNYLKMLYPKKYLNP